MTKEMIYASINLLNKIYYFRNISLAKGLYGSGDYQFPPLTFAGTQ